MVLIYLSINSILLNKISIIKIREMTKLKKGRFINVHVACPVTVPQLLQVKFQQGKCCRFKSIIKPKYIHGSLKVMGTTKIY